MAFTLCELKNDIRNLDVQMIYDKYILSDDNWYFENVLSASSGHSSEIATKFTCINDTSIKLKYSVKVIL